MTRLTHVCRTVGVGLAVTTAALALTQVAHAAPSPPTGPASLAPPAGNEMFLASHGKGVQIYQCNGTSWTFGALKVSSLEPGGSTRAGWYSNQA